MNAFLDFEKPIAELQSRIDELRDADSVVDIDAEVARLQAKSDKLLKDTYAKLTPWQKTQVARHPERPHFKDYVAGLLDDFMPLAGDRAFADDQAIMGGLGVLGGRKVMVIGHEKGDVPRGDISALANAYARLIVAAGGGTLGLFTAIRRLRGVHARIADRLAREGLPLHAQHVDPIDTGTLVDIFRDDPHASLLGTDALRDGVDVPGSSLRLVVMEGVPWAKPSVLHAARRLAHSPESGGPAYDDRIVRARLAQAFGRLIRRSDDRGAFVLLSAAVPSRLLTAFPPGVGVNRVTLDEAVSKVTARLATTALSSAAMLGHGASS